MNVKYQIFVSSTYEDLKDERNEVIKACLNMGHIPVGMEMFNAADEEQWAVITRTIDQCDYHVVIVAHRYGSKVNGVSFTEKEYDYAIAQGVPVLGFVIEDGAPWPNDRSDKDQAAIDALRAFKSRVKQKMVRSWRDKSELQAQFAMSFGTYINLNPRRGWVRAPEAGAADVAQALSNLSEENARLRKEIEEIRSVSKLDEVDRAISLLTDQIDNLSGHDFFMSLMERSNGAISSRFAFLQEKSKGLEGSARVERENGLSDALRQLQLWGLIDFYGAQGASDRFGFTELGRRVYNRLDLERRSRPPF